MEIIEKIRVMAVGGEDMSYWESVLKQLRVHLAKMEVDEIFDVMGKRWKEKVELRKEEEKNDPEKFRNSSGGGSSSSAAGGGEEDGNNQEGDEETDMTNDSEITLINEYKWSDKYRPRKPRYFNRVKTGWDWNKYNQTHYDHDNPPPKIVQGYKFNIFFPDLIDKSSTPSFFLEAAESPEFAILRFRGGPPYEDVAFKILNKEWSKSRKKGYKCTFDRGVLTLFFNFNSHWYRR